MSQIKRTALFISLYLAQGLPYGFFMQALPVLLRKSGTSLALVGASSLLTLPWGIKFLWAPLVDRFGVAKIGLRRSWILPLQFATVVLFAGLAELSPEHSLKLILQGVLLANFFAATQDIATDAFAIDILSREERGWAGGIKVGGYRIGMILGGGVILQFAPLLKWNGLMYALALISLVCTLPVMFYREAPSRYVQNRPSPVLTATVSARI